MWKWTQVYLVCCLTALKLLMLQVEHKGQVICQHKYNTHIQTVALSLTFTFNCQYHRVLVVISADFSDTHWQIRIVSILVRVAVLCCLPVEQLSALKHHDPAWAVTRSASISLISTQAVTVSLFHLSFFLPPRGMRDTVSQNVAVQVFNLMRMNAPELRLSDWPHLCF